MYGTSSAVVKVIECFTRPCVPNPAGEAVRKSDMKELVEDLKLVLKPVGRGCTLLPASQTTSRVSSGVLEVTQSAMTLTLSIDCYCPAAAQICKQYQPLQPEYRPLPKWDKRWASGASGISGAWKGIEAGTGADVRCRGYRCSF